MHNCDVEVEVLEKILKSFKIKCDSIKYSSGETIDVYDLKLSPGVKTSNVDKALLDIGVSMRAHSCPIGYPILREGVYRIEVQKSGLRSCKFNELSGKKYDMYNPVILGLDFDNKPLVKDLHKLPNLLIGGIPGSGKSVLLHSIIMSEILADASIYLIDPKMVEFGIYSDFKNVKEIAYDIDNAFRILSLVQIKMEERFALFNKKKVRDVLEYNKTYKKSIKPIVIIIDEWADLVLKDKKIQDQLCIIAQKGRAAGISSIIATQRPSAKIISGLIKSNFSGRIAMRVASALESRIVLDYSGAEKLKDVGTGLYIDHNSNKPVLFRSPWILDVKKELESDSFKNKKKNLLNRILGL